ncbi:MAG: hypothetical protein NUW01_02330 [Gemmatimonadaceae bacterium]|nr:hypothetical protein [Gemmatimonadaceae bacterium]
METVTIRVTPDQRDRIDTLKVHPRETVSDVMQRLLERYALTEREHAERAARIVAREAQERS